MASGYLFNKHTCWKEICFIAKEGKKKVHYRRALHQSDGAVPDFVEVCRVLSREAVGDLLNERTAAVVQHLSPGSGEKRYSCNTMGNSLPAVAISQVKLRQELLAGTSDPAALPRLSYQSQRSGFTPTHSLKHTLQILPIKMVVLNIPADC